MSTAVLLFRAGACSAKTGEPPEVILADARQQLRERGRTDQAVREGFGAGGTVDSAQGALMARTDSTNTTWLKAYVAR